MAASNNQAGNGGQGGFRQWLSRQGQNMGGSLREQFSLPRTADGRVNYGALFGQAALGAAFGPLGSMAGRGLFGNMDFGGIASGARGVGTSFGRMFDGDPRTGFGNNPTAPWNWGSGPRNVPEGHPDFMGAPNPFLQGNDPYGDPRNMGPPAPGGDPYGDPRNMGPPAPQQGGGMGGAGIGGRSLSSINSAMRYLQNAPPGSRGYGIAGRLGIGGNQSTGIGAFNGPSDIGNSRGEFQRHNYER